MVNLCKKSYKAEIELQTGEFNSDLEARVKIFTGFHSLITFVYTYLITGYII